MGEYYSNNGVSPVTEGGRLPADENWTGCRLTPFDEKQIEAEQYAN